MKKIVFVVSFFLIQNSFLFSQDWFWQNPKPQGDIVKFLAIKDNNTLLTLTYYSIFISTDGGQSWIERLFPEGFKPSAFTLNGDSLWLISSIQTDESYLYVSTDLGINWSLISQLPQPASSICFLNNFGWFISQQNRIFVTYDRGLTWEELVNIYNLSGIQFISNSYAIAYNFHSGNHSTLFKTTDCGLNWKVIGEYTTPISTIKFVDQYLGAVSFLFDYPIKTTDGGDTWNTLNILARVQFQDKLIGWANNNNGLYRTIDGGNIWTQIFNQRARTFVSRENTIFISDINPPALFYSNNLGSTWDTLYHDCINNNLHSICFWDSLEGIAVGNNGKTYLTSNAGYSWKEVNTDETSNLNKVVCRGNQECWIAGQQGTILYSSDKGNNWTSKNINTSANLTGIQVLNDNNVLAYLDNAGVFYKTTDKGDTWDRVYFPTSPPPYATVITTAYFIDENCGWAVENLGSIYRTINGGINWVQTCNLYSNNILNWEIHFSNSHYGWLYRVNILSRTTDGGLTWSDISLPVIHSEYPSRIFFLNDSTIFVLTGKGYLYKTFDYATTFQVERLNYSTLEELFFINDYKGWAIGQNIIISSFDATPIVNSVIDDHIISLDCFQISQNYPNPFNPSTSIRYAISSRQFVSLRVYDVLGKEIAALVNEEKNAGSYETEFNASHLASGIYYYRLRAGDYVETKKMLMIK
jgi:photosystem II stability/assembly factor-like uncharacterized protein